MERSYENHCQLAVRQTLDHYNPENLIKINNMDLNFLIDVDECSFDRNFSVRPTSEADVSVIVKAARDADLPISIRRLGVVLVERFHLTIHNMQTL